MWYKIDSLYDCYLLRRLKSTENNIPRFVHSGVCFFFGIFCPKIKVCDFFSYTWTDAHYIVQFSGKPCLGSNISRNIIPNHVKFGRDRGKHVFYLWGCSDVNKECQFFFFLGSSKWGKVQKFQMWVILGAYRPHFNRHTWHIKGHSLCLNYNIYLTSGQNPTSVQPIEFKKLTKLHEKVTSTH